MPQIRTARGMPQNLGYYHENMMFTWRTVNLANGYPVSGRVLDMLLRQRWQFANIFLALACD
jgi:hypothetical protein